MIQIDVRRGRAVAPYLDDLARLRIEVFRDYPYLYDGSLAYESEYLQTYARSPSSVFVVAVDAGEVVGVATAIALADETAAIRAPFAASDVSIETVFYLGESVLLSGYRGRGIGHRFFDEREACARVGGFTVAAFCSVLRPSDDSRRPVDFRSNDPFWRKRGYRPQPAMHCDLAWREVGETEDSNHGMVVWMRDLDDGR